MIEKAPAHSLSPFWLALIDSTSRQQQTQRMLLYWLRVEYAIEKLGNKLLAVTELESDTWVGASLVGEVAARKGSSPPSLSEAEERGMKFSIVLPRVALADSLTRGYFLNPCGVLEMARGIAAWSRALCGVGK